MNTLYSTKDIASQGKGSLLDGGESVKLDTLTNTVTSSYGITGNQSDKRSSGRSALTLTSGYTQKISGYSANIPAQSSAKVSAGQSAKLSAGLSGGTLSYPNPDIPNRGEITPFVEFLESIKKGSIPATRFVQSLSSIPRDCNSFLIIRFIQAETDASPSCFKAALIPCSNDGSTRKAICLFPLPDILMVDTWFTPNYIKNEHQVYDRCIPKTTPPNGIISTNRGLTTNDIISIEVAMSQYITPVTGRNSLTPSQSFRWLFLALERGNPTARPHRIEATAPNEHSARLLLVRDYILAFAGRLPVREVNNA